MDLDPLLTPDRFSIKWSNNKVARTSSALPYLSALQDSGKLQEFSVYNDEQGDFVATAIAPNTAPFPYSPEDLPQLAPPEALSSAPPLVTPEAPSGASESSTIQVLFDDDPRNNQRGVEPYFCSGFASDCEFGSCNAKQRVVWGPFCREGTYPYIQPGNYQVTVDGVGDVKLGATDFGVKHEMFTFGGQTTTLPAEFTFCWPGRQANGYGFETIVLARAAGAYVNHIRIEYLGGTCPN